MATTQLSYTPTLGTLTKWTFSGWFKKAAPTGYQQMIAVPSGSAYTVIKFETAGQISFENYDKELIKEDKRFEEMSVMAFNDPSTGGNPTQLSDKDFLQLYKNAYNGIL